MPRSVAVQWGVGGDRENPRLHMRRLDPESPGKDFGWTFRAMGAIARLRVTCTLMKACAGACAETGPAPLQTRGGLCQSSGSGQEERWCVCTYFEVDSTRLLSESNVRCEVNRTSKDESRVWARAAATADQTMGRGER